MAAISPGVRGLAPAALVTLAVSAATAGPASAQLTLDSTQVNVFNSSAPADTERTWFGYVTNPTPFSGSQGEVSPLAPGVGPTVTKLSPRGLDQVHTYSHPALTSTLDMTTRTGTAQFQGGMRFFSPGPAPAAGHDFTITITNPRVVLLGSSGQLYASGQGSEGAYTDTQPIYNLDLSNARLTTEGDGTRILSCIVPSIATAGLVYPAANYPTGHGPNRRPNTFGSFTLRDGAIDAYPSCEPTPATPAKPAAPPKPTTPAKRQALKQRVRMRRAPFGKRRRRITVRTRRKRLVATGIARGRTLRLRLRVTKRLKGVYVLRLKHRRRGEPRAVTIRIR